LENDKKEIQLDPNQFIILAKVLEQGAFSEETVDRLMMQAANLYHYQQLSKAG